MKLHQIQLRKDGPIHAIEHLRADDYADRTLCGYQLLALDEPQRRRFATADHRCKRCEKSEALLP